jgi:hypothetical protein
VLIVATLSAPVFAQSNDDVDPRITAYKNHNDPEYIAERLRLQGKCDEAVPIFRQIVAQQYGYHETQFHLAGCLFMLAKAEHDPAKARALNAEAAGLIVHAANDNISKAQALAVQLYLDGTGVAADPVEAAKWAYVFHDNGNRLALGQPDLDADLRTKLEGGLTADQRRKAHALANAWTPSGDRSE